MPRFMHVHVHLPVHEHLSEGLTQGGGCAELEERRERRRGRCEQLAAVVD